jgi:long-chain acyl-CoA synthetase
MIDTLPRMLKNTLKSYPKEDLMLTKRAGVYEPLSTAEFGKMVRQFALGLRELGVGREDKVVLLSENRPEWVMTDLAVVCLRGITVPIYTTLIPEQIKFIIESSDAKVVVCSMRELWEKIEIIRPELNRVQHYILFEPEPPAGTRFWEDVLAAGEKLDKEDPDLFGRLTEEVEPEDVMTIIFTSGTTGVPKGAMLTHANLISNAESVLSIIDVSFRDTVVSFLPLSHILERWAMCCYLYVGATIGFAESIESLSENMLEVRPTIMVTVPRLLEKIYARVLDTVLSGSALKRAIFHWAVKVGRRYAQKKIRGQSVPGFLNFQRGIAYKLVFAKIYARTGGRLRFFVSGGAPLAKEIGEFFYALGMMTLEGYGLTETSPVISCNRPEELKYGSVGKPIPGVDVKVALDGEILARGPNIMVAYYKNEAATQETFEGEWFKTGDVGHIDEEGFLVITDRKKDLIVTSGGKNVAPQPIENTLKSTRYILNAVLVGDRRNFISALIVPDFEKLEAYAKKKGIPFSSRGELVKHEKINDFMMKEINAATANYSRYEKIKRFVLLEREFELEKGEITPSLKVKRHMIEKKYSSLIDSLYRERDGDA